MRFINREREIGLLKRIRGSFRVAIIGRRRVGKTRLVEECFGERCLTFFIPAEKAEKELIASWVEGYPDLHLPLTSTLNSFFDSVFAHFKDRVIFLDEIQNITRVNASFLFDLQRLIDKHRPTLVVTGSLIRAMKGIIESYRSPLYGRFDLIITLDELHLPSACRMGKSLRIPFREMLSTYMVVGGIPKYYELIEKLGAFHFDEFVLEQFITYPRPLYEEAKAMLREEFGAEHRTFFSILSAIAHGARRLSEIAGFVGRKETHLTKYIALLRDDFRLIEPLAPVAGSAHTLYAIRNNIFAFWFMVPWRYSQLMETGAEAHAAALMKVQVAAYLSFRFEHVIREALRAGHVPLPFPASRIGAQWGRFKGEKGKNTYEIDVCALDEKGKQILFAECKWQDDVDAAPVLAGLKKKAQHVDWNIGRRNEHYAIFAKSFKRRVAEPNVLLVDLRAFEKMLAGKGG